MEDVSVAECRWELSLPKQWYSGAVHNLCFRVAVGFRLQRVGEVRDGSAFVYILPGENNTFSFKTDNENRS